MMPHPRPAIVRLKKWQAPEILAFLREHYGANYGEANARYFEWLYMEHPCAWFRADAEKDDLPANGVLDAHGRVRALHTFLPFDAITPWGGEKGAWDLEWINGSGVRGVGRALSQHLLSQVDVYAGFGCNEMSRSAFRALGLALIEEIPRVAAILNPQRLSLLLDAQRGHTGWDLGQAGLANTTSCANWQILQGTRAISSDLLAIHRASVHIGVERTPEWLEWRYDSNPFLQYVVLNSLDRPDSGVAVLRLEAIVDTPLKVGRLVEFFPRSPDLAGDLLKAVVGFATDQDCLLLDFFTPSKKHALAILAAAASRNLAFQLNPDLPCRFQPLDSHAPFSINFVIGIGGAASGRSIQDLPDHFFATKGDANQDILRNPATAPILKKAS